MADIKKKARWHMTITNNGKVMYDGSAAGIPCIVHGKIFEMKEMKEYDSGRKSISFIVSSFGKVNPETKERFPGAHLYCTAWNDVAEVISSTFKVGGWFDALCDYNVHKYGSRYYNTFSVKQILTDRQGAEIVPDFDSPDYVGSPNLPY